MRWIWLTHPDRDHTGALFELLEKAPQARVVTTFLGVGIMSTATPLPMDRVYLLNPGQSLEMGDRRLRAFRPPLFDSPATVGFYDERSRACFSSDCFGARLPSPELASSDIAPDDLRAAQLLWAAVESPWVHLVDQAKYAATIRTVQEMDPSVVLNTHQPPAAGQNPQLLDMLAAAPDANAFVGPDQRALEAVLAGFEPEGTTPAQRQVA